MRSQYNLYHETSNEISVNSTFSNDNYISSLLNVLFRASRKINTKLFGITSFACKPSRVWGIPLCLLIWKIYVKYYSHEFVMIFLRFPLFSNTNWNLSLSVTLYLCYSAVDSRLGFPY